MTYLHHNYPPFTNTIEECSGVMDALSAAESLMSSNAQGEEVSGACSSLVFFVPCGAFARRGHQSVCRAICVTNSSIYFPLQGYRRLPLTSLYGFQLSIRGTLLSLPSPVPRRRQVLRKSELWENSRLERQNEEGIEEVMQLERKRAMQRIALGGEGESAGGLGLGAELKRTVVCETVPWLGVIKPRGAQSPSLQRPRDTPPRLFRTDRFRTTPHLRSPNRRKPVPPRPRDFPSP